MDDDEVYVLVGEATHGPMTVEEARVRRRSGELPETALACKLGASEWAPIDEIVRARPPPPPPPPPPPRPVASAAPLPAVPSVVATVAPPAYSELLLVVLAVMVGGVLGVIVSQYVPIFGGFATIGQPWSPARRSLIGEHVLAFVAVLVVAVLGLPRIAGQRRTAAGPSNPAPTPETFREPPPVVRSPESAPSARTQELSANQAARMLDWGSFVVDLRAIGLLLVVGAVVIAGAAFWLRDSVKETERREKFAAAVASAQAIKPRALTSAEIEKRRAKENALQRRKERVAAQLRYEGAVAVNGTIVLSGAQCDQLGATIMGQAIRQRIGDNDLAAVGLTSFECHHPSGTSYKMTYKLVPEEEQPPAPAKAEGTATSPAPAPSGCRSCDDEQPAGASPASPDTNVDPDCWPCMSQEDFDVAYGKKKKCCPVEACAGDADCNDGRVCCHIPRGHLCTDARRCPASERLP